MRILFNSIVVALGLTTASLALADEASVKAALIKKFPQLTTSLIVKKTQIPGVYRLNLSGKLAYTNEKVEFLLVGGSLINPATLEDLTVQDQGQMLGEFFDSLPFDKAIKTVYGKGERKLVTFESPDCPFCKKQVNIFSADPNKLNATVYTFLVPLSQHLDSSRKSKFFYCSPNGAELYKQWMNWDPKSGKKAPIPLLVNGNQYTIQEGTFVLDPSVDPLLNCPAAANVDIANKLFSELKFDSTPRHVFSNGYMAKGWLSSSELEQGFDLAKKPPIVK